MLSWCFSGAFLVLRGKVYDGFGMFVMVGGRYVP